MKRVATAAAVVVPGRLTVRLLSARADCPERAIGIRPCRTGGTGDRRSGHIAIGHRRQVSAAGKATRTQLGVQIYWHDVNGPYAVKGNADRALRLCRRSGSQQRRHYVPDLHRWRPADEGLHEVGRHADAGFAAGSHREAKARGLRVMRSPDHR